MKSDRLISLLLLLQSAQRRTARELAARLEVSERTIYRDVDALSASGVPVYTERGPEGGIALADGYRNALTHFAEDEVRALFISGSAILSDLGLGANLDRALEKLRGGFSDVQRKAAEKAFGMANLKPRDMQGVEVHDCFSITEIVAYEILGLAEPGKGAQLAMTGATALPQVRNEKVSGKIDFEIPVNAGGGLIGDGHPVGATGVYQAVEAVLQLRGSAGANQVADSKVALIQSVGGLASTVITHVLQT